MTYRGIVSNGVVVLEGEKPPEGTVVEITPVVPAPKSFAELPGFGIWRDRTDLPEDSAEASKVLGEQLMRRSDE
jgi:hypothetical protein